MSLNEYIKGRRHGKEAHKLERESMQDPFLSDAIDGYASVNEKHIERIGDIRRRITRRTRQTNRWFTYAGIAASLLVFITVGGYFLFNDKQDNFLAKNEYMLKDEAVSDLMDAEYPIIVEMEESDAGENIKNKEVMLAEHMVLEESLKKERVMSETPAVIVESKNNAVAEEEVVLAEEKDATSALDNDEADDEVVMMAFESVVVADRVASEAQKKVVISDSVLTQTSGKQERKAAALSETPEPKIGWKDYEKYIVDSLRRPSVGDCAKLNGTVEVTFNIDENGSPKDIMIYKSLCPDADAEAIRLVNEGSLWTSKSYKRMKVIVKF